MSAVPQTYLDDIGIPKNLRWAKYATKCYTKAKFLPRGVLKGWARDPQCRKIAVITISRKQKIFWRSKRCWVQSLHEDNIQHILPPDSFLKIKICSPTLLSHSMKHIPWFVHGQSYIDVMRPQMFLFIMDGENLDSEWYNTSQKTYRRKESLLDEHSLCFATFCYKNSITRKVITGKGSWHRSRAVIKAVCALW